MGLSQRRMQDPMGPCLWCFKNVISLLSPLLFFEISPESSFGKTRELRGHPLPPPAVRNSPCTAVSSTWEVIRKSTDSQLLEIYFVLKHRKARTVDSQCGTKLTFRKSKSISSFYWLRGRGTTSSSSFTSSFHSTGDLWPQAGQPPRGSALPRHHLRLEVGTL